MGAGRRACLADLEPAVGGAPIADPRGAVRRAVAACGELGLDPIVGPELEFFLVEHDPAAPNGDQAAHRPAEHGLHGRPAGRSRRHRSAASTEALAAMGIEAFAFNHEFMNSQYEINLRHADALTAADRAFRLKAAVKDVAAQNGLVATFMGKPFNDQGGSGTHLHVSLDRDGRNAFGGRRRRQRRDARVHRRRARPRARR